jgi:hypothetical protein
LYVPDVSEVVAWRPDVPGLTEVLHAHFTDHVYPAHTHEAWTLLLVDDGAVRYDLDRHAHGATRGLVTLLPPGVPHDGRSSSPAGFRKRVLYLEPDTLGARRVGTAVDQPAVDDAVLRDRLSALHRRWNPAVTCWRRRAGSGSCWSGSRSTSTAPWWGRPRCGTTSWPTGCAS